MEGDVGVMKLRPAKRRLIRLSPGSIVAEHLVPVDHLAASHNRP